MTLAQIDALMRVENKANGKTNAGAGNLPPPSQRRWGSAHDFAQWEKRANV